MLEVISSNEVKINLTILKNIIDKGSGTLLIPKNSTLDTLALGKNISHKDKIIIKDNIIRLGATKLSRADFGDTFRTYKKEGENLLAIYKDELPFMMYPELKLDKMKLSLGENTLLYFTDDLCLI